MRISIAALALLGGCSPFCLPAPATEPTHPLAVVDETSPLPLTVSVKDLMDGAIAFSAHVVEEVEGSVTPLTKSDWGAVRVAASDQMAAATLLTTPNDNPIDTFRRRDPEWRIQAKALQDAGADIVAASRVGDRDRLASGVFAMRAACKTCHARYGVHGQ